jgi:hypothetical protein
MTDPIERIDYTERGLDDVAVGPVSLFRMEWMGDGEVWILLYRDGAPSIRFALSAASKITGFHEFQDE